MTVKLLFKKFLSRRSLLISAMLACLLLAQISAIQHDTEHLQQDHQQLCHSFINYDNHHTIVNIPSLSTKQSIFFDQRLFYSSLKRQQISSNQQARAPPLAA